jgi:hypothetical protein
VINAPHIIIFNIITFVGHAASPYNFVLWQGNYEARLILVLKTVFFPIYLLLYSCTLHANLGAKNLAENPIIFPQYIGKNV